MKNITINDCLKYFPLRIAITDHCNLNCFFCSNEGMPLSQKNQQNIDIEKMFYLVKVLVKAGLKNIAITGGDPLMHPDFEKITSFLSKISFNNCFLHTNGVHLSENNIKRLRTVFNKVAVSVHCADREVWKRITRGTSGEYNGLIKNLKTLSASKDDFAIEIKYVPLKEINSSVIQIKKFLDFCDKFGFKFKFLNFEPITKSHLRYSVSYGELEKKLRSAGCGYGKKDKEFRGQSRYLPIKRFSYKNTGGVAIEIGCGDRCVCGDCYRTNEMFITPDLFIKPCHADSFQIDLNEFIEAGDKAAILKAFLNSRNFLKKAPGVGKKVWDNN